MVHAALPESWEILLVAQHQHRALVDAIGRREGARADAIAREHARIAQVNLDIAVENRHLLERVPARRCCVFRPLHPDPCRSRSGRHGSSAVHVRPMRADDVDAADRVLRLAFGTIRGLPDPSAAFGDSDLVRTRFRAAPDCAGPQRSTARSWDRFSQRLGLVRLPRPAHRPSRPLGSRDRRSLLACARGVRALGPPSGQALHLRGQPQAPRPLPEARLLARIPHGRDLQGDGPVGARLLRARLERAGEPAQPSWTRSAD